MRLRPSLVALTAVTTLAAGCSRDEPVATAPASPSTQSVKPKLGPIRSSAVVFEFAIYHLPRPRTDPVKRLRRLARDVHFVVLSAEPDDAPPQSSVWVAKVDIVNYRPPSLELLEYYGVGLSSRQKRALQDCKAVTVVRFYSNHEASTQPMYATALKVMADLRKATGGVLWDEHTRQVFSRRAWQRRIDAWQDGLPSVEDHVAIHAYPDGQLVRIVTLGLDKFGLPEIAVNDASRSSAPSLVNLVNVCGQLLIEGAPVSPDGELVADIAAIKQKTFRERIMATMTDKASGRATISLALAKPREGDNDARQLEIEFPRDPRRRQQEQQALIGLVFGSTDALYKAQHDDELLAASRRARKRLAALKPRFVKKSGSIDLLLVKAPFKTSSGGQEWMWVEVVGWSGPTIEGILQNDPFEVPELKAGSRVLVDEGEIFDYLLRTRDGMEGNETGQILMRRQQQKGSRRR